MTADTITALDLARKVLRIEADAIARLIDGELRRLAVERHDGAGEPLPPRPVGGDDEHGVGAIGQRQAGRIRRTCERRR